MLSEEVVIPDGVHLLTNVLLILLLLHSALWMFIVSGSSLWKQVVWMMVQAGRTDNV